VTTEEAKEALLRYRPGRPSGEDPSVEEAKAACERDEALRAWFEEHCRLQVAVKDGFRSILPPAGLKEQIISERRAALYTEKTGGWKRSRVVQFTGVALLTLVVWGVMSQRWGGGGEETSLAGYRKRMVGFALRTYSMELKTSKIEDIRQHLARRSFPSAFRLPPSVLEVPVVGCGSTRWQDAKVSMICFLRGEPPLASGVESDLWMFVMDGPNMKGRPRDQEIVVEKVNRLWTATWEKDGKLYLLATPGEEADLRRWL